MKKKSVAVLLLCGLGCWQAASGSDQEIAAQKENRRMTEEMVTYETLPAKLPYPLTREISRDEWLELVKHVMNNKLSNADANAYMWGHLYKMHSWIAINLAGDAGMRPFAGVIDGNPSLTLFTSKTIANDFIKSRKLAERYPELELTGFLVPSTLRHLEGYQSQGITWVNFNQGSDTPFGGPINLLETGYRWCLANDPSFAAKKGNAP